MAADTAAVVFGGRASSKVNVGQGLVGGIGISSMLRTDLTLVSHRSLRCEDNSNRWLQGLQLLVNEGQARLSPLAGTKSTWPTSNQSPITLTNYNKLSNL